MNEIDVERELRLAAALSVVLQTAVDEGMSRADATSCALGFGIGVTMSEFGCGPEEVGQRATLLAGEIRALAPAVAAHIEGRR